MTPQSLLRSCSTSAIALARLNLSDSAIKTSDRRDVVRPGDSYFHCYPSCSSEPLTEDLLLTWDCYWLTNPPEPRLQSSDQSWPRQCSW